MNTLRSWSNQNSVVVSRHAHARCVAVGSPNSAKLYHLEDYRVSSVAAGNIWLIRKKPFSDAENRERANIRNLCVGAGSGDKALIQLDLLCQMEGKSEFWGDCVAEYILELKAEMRDAGDLVDE